MLFNSLIFAVFFPVVFFLYWSAGHRLQNRVLLAASYLFYGWWDWRFLGLIILTSAIDFYCARKIEDSAEGAQRKRFLILSAVSNLSILGFFKYFNFFADSLRHLLLGLGFEAPELFFNIVLPVGISFYTFQSLSYTIDVYRKSIPAQKEFLNYALFVSFFPQLVAGPIERASALMPQVTQPRTYKDDQITEGCWLFLWGLFQKMVLADQFAKIADPVFDGTSLLTGASALTALYAFAFQIFCDFAGYSNMARGLAKLLGFELMINFEYPYFVKSPSAFWKNWHISLSRWLKDYVYIPLGGNRLSGLMTYRNLLLTMVLGGLWHGAAWTYVAWGLYHGLLLIAFRAAEPYFSKAGIKGFFSKLPAARFLGVLGYFQLTCLGWLLFRASSLTQARDFFSVILSDFSAAEMIQQPFSLNFFILACVLTAFEWFHKSRGSVLAVLKTPLLWRWTAYFVLFHSIFIFGVEKAQSFVYFQF